VAELPVIAAFWLSLSVLGVGACSSPQHPAAESATGSPASSVTPGANSLNAHLRTADGRDVASATFEFTSGYVTVTIKTVAAGILTPGFHEMHVHEIGKCEPNSVAPTGGPPGDFLSAGGHFQATGHTGKPASGDLTSLEVRSDGSGYLVTTTDAFTREELLAGSKTALMLHGTEDGGMGGMGDMAMPPRVACGVIGTG
jgi:superoxide dismutase, Cu-Zn family